jgi:phage terminase large subunit-like protein
LESIPVRTAFGHDAACLYHHDAEVHQDPLATSKSPDRLDALVWALTDLMLDVPQRNYGLVSVQVIG